jgi:hypothetical protein
MPGWVFGIATYEVLSDGRLLALYWWVVRGGEGGGGRTCLLRASGSRRGSTPGRTQLVAQATRPPRCRRCGWLLTAPHLRPAAGQGGRGRRSPWWTLRPRA